MGKQDAETIKGEYADLVNVADHRTAPSSFAAEFLRRFVDDRPWVHMDTRDRLRHGAQLRRRGRVGVRHLIQLASRSVR